MGPAGVLRDVAADRARFLARGVGREVKPRVFNRAGEIEIHHARLDHRALVLEIEFEDAVHPRKDQQNSAVPRERPARKPSTRAASYQRDLEAVCQEHDLHDVARRAREDNILRPRLLDRTVIFVEHQVLGLPEHSVLTEGLLELANEFLIHRTSCLYPLFSLNLSQGMACQAPTHNAC